jgi:hypothetical protein
MLDTQAFVWHINQILLVLFGFLMTNPGNVNGLQDQTEPAQETVR